MQKILITIIIFSALVALSLAQKNATVYQVIVLENYENKYFSCVSKIYDLCNGNSYSLRRQKDNLVVKDPFYKNNRDHLHYFHFQKNSSYPNNSTNTTKLNSQDIIKCKSATDYYQRCMVSGYEISNYKSSEYYDMNFKVFPKYLVSYSLQCEAQSLANFQNTPYGKNQIDQYHNCYNILSTSRNDPDSTQHAVSQFAKYSAACKNKYNTQCDSTCVNMYSKFEQCVLICQNNIYVTNGYYINRQVRNHITNCMTACNKSFNVSKDNRTNPILQCIAYNTEITNGTMISGTILQYFGFLMTILFISLF